jgi:hypothetical protein
VGLSPIQVHQWSTLQLARIAGVSFILPLVVLSCSGSRGRDASTPTTSTISTPELDELPKPVVAAVTYLGETMQDMTPSSAVYYLMNRNEATMVLAEASAENDAPAYVVVLKGSFVYASARGQGGPPPTGTVAFAIVDPASNRIRGVGVRDSQVDLSKLGKGTPFRCCPPVAGGG